MKKITLISCLLLSWLTIFAQTITINVSGVVNTVNGGPAAGVNILIQVPGTNGTLLYFGSVLTNPNGYYTESFDVPSLLSQGVVYVSMVDCDSSVQATTNYWYPPSLSITQNFTYCTNTTTSCSAFVNIDTLNSNGAIITAYATGTAPFTYAWSDGSATEQINPTQFGTYCVTITDATGCTSSDCIDYQAPGDCGVWIQSDPNAGLTAIAGGVAPYTYSWSNGQNTQTIIPNAPGAYCVTVIDATGCVSIACSQFGGGGQCETYIYPNVSGGLTAYSQGIGVLTYTWSTGETTQSIYPVQAGEYCVSTTDINGCQSSDCYYFDPNPIDTFCYVYITDYQVPGTVVHQLTAYGANVPFQSYLWNTGATTSQIQVTEEGTYCVTVTTSNGCVTEACVDVYNSNGQCYTYIFPDSSGNLIAYSTGTGAISYGWSTGETTSMITPTTPGNYCVTITDATGCTSSDCFNYQIPGDCSVWIQSDPNGGLTAVATGTPPFSYYWSNTQTGATFFPPSPGVYCVSVIDATGCVSQACAQYGGGGQCYTYIYPDSSGTLTAYSQGTGAIAYNWSTGETTAQITPVQTGYYCVTTTDANGCESSDCYYYDPNPIDSNCYVYIVDTPIFGTTMHQLTAYGANVFFASYQWSTGETGSQIQVSENGQYCVTVSTPAPNTCVATACTYVFPDSLNFFNIQGFVTAQVNTSSYYGEVYLIRVDTFQNDFLLTAVDTFSFQAVNGSAQYNFSNVTTGRYFIKAAINPNSPDYANTLPTYYGDVLFWNEATPVDVPNPAAVYNINMVNGVNPGGPGFIGGLVSEGANFQGHGGTIRNEGDPLPGVNVLLLTDSDSPITHAVSGNDGTFAFSNLAWGTYKVYVEILGLEPYYTLVTIGPDQPTANIGFEVGSHTVVSATNDLPGISDMLVYPNPTSNIVNVGWKATSDSNMNIALKSVTGEQVITRSTRSNQGTHVVQLDLNTLPSGIYFLTLTDGTNNLSRKIVKK